MSGYNYAINRQLLFGADDFVAKPFHSEFLMQKVETLLDEAVPVLPNILGGAEFLSPENPS